MPQSTLDAYGRDADDGGPRADLSTHEGHVRHPLVRPGALQARPYQTRLAAKAVEASLLVVLPTGLGKTAIATLAAAELLARDPRAKAVIVAPTRPLVHQHARALRDALLLGEDEVVALTGHVAPAERAAAFAGARVVASTPHGLANDVEAGRVRLDEVALLVVDEAHRSVGAYPYVPLVAAYRAQRAETRVLGLTASPGGHRARVAQVRAALGQPRVEALEREDDDVRAFVKGTLVRFHHVQLPEPTRQARDALARMLAERVAKLRAFVPRKGLPERIGRGVLLETGEAIRKRLAAAKGASKEFCFAAMQNHAVAVQTLHALALLETQGLAPFLAYVERVDARQEGERTRAPAAFLGDARVQQATRLARAALVSHPKENALMEALHAQLARKPGSLVLVFAQYRDTVRGLVARIGRAGFPVGRFVGQQDKGAGDPGLTQEEQALLLQRFAHGGVRVLVATSVAEEGLHVPSVDLVIFYEPVPSEIRTIQRRGRTGRSQVGRVLVLVTEDSQDEVALRVEAEREAEMRRIVGDMRAEATTG